MNDKNNKHETVSEAEKSQEILQQPCGYFNNKPLYLFVLKNSSVEINIINLGCTITSIKTPDKTGNIKNIVAGFKTITEYENNKYFFGCVVGRYVNRISNGRFKIDDKEYQLTVNDSINHLHGGNQGFHKQVWNVAKLINDEKQASIKFHYFSKDGEEGFPGNVNVAVQYLLNNNNELFIHYKATTDKATPISLTNHSYFNLSGFETLNVKEHLLQINADEYTEKNNNNQPTGYFLNVNDSVFDFRSAKKIGTDLNDKALKNDKGYDHNFVVKHSNSNEILHAAQLTDAESGRNLDVYTNAPGMQLYTANFWDGSIVGAQNEAYVQHGAVALETQSFPDSPNHSHFPKTILYPGEEYHSTTIYRFGIKQ
jgi:aldose 1-epimerase